MPKDRCPKCENDKDCRSKHCRSCMEKPRPKNLNVTFHAKTGYNYIMVDGKCLWEHRYRMESHLGIKLRRDQHVHHKNGIRTDNRLENLELMSAKDHCREHMHFAEAQRRSFLGHKARWGYENSYL